MSEPFVGEIKMFAGNFAPRGYALCNGQLLDIASNTALFSLLGTTYGGDGRTNFALPDLRGRLPLHDGTGPGLPPYRLGQRGGAETVALTPTNLPAHSHPVRGSTKGGDQRSPDGAIPAVDATGATALYTKQAPDEHMDWPATTNTGVGQQHTNVMPFLCINFIIALIGIFPSRN